ncbi:MAG: hypothetical protein J5928_00985 [Firmicutes bacterium]|nr:hypothetical protein [Bacillota bacterium]
MEHKIRIDLEGQVISVPEIGQDMYRFNLSNVAKGGVNDFTVYVKKKKDETVDVHKGDTVIIYGAGYFRKIDSNGIIASENLTVGDDARIFVIRENNNEGFVDGKTFYLESR